MLKSIRNALLSCIVLVLAITPAWAPAAPQCRATASASRSAVSALVDRINGLGLVDDGWPVPPWERSFSSPFAEWYVRSIVAEGSDKPPDDLGAASTLVSEVASLPQATLTASIWASPGAAHAVAQRLRGLCVRTMTSAWPIGMRAAVKDSGGFINDLTHVAMRAAKHHPLNLVVSFSVASRIGRVTSEWPQPRTIAYYDGDGVSGVRLKNPSSPLALYIFTGTPSDLTNFSQSFLQKSAYSFADPALAADRWKQIQIGFKPATVFLAPLDVSSFARKAFAPDLDLDTAPIGLAYGVTINTVYNRFTGMVQSDFFVRNGSVSLSTVAGVEGTDAPQDLKIHFYPARSSHSIFALPLAATYFLVDEQNGLILDRGEQSGP